jgi:hypothetical protein
MTQPISAYRPDRSRDVPDSGPPTPPATRVAVPQPSIPELPDTDAAFVANAVKAATSNAPHLLLAMGVKGADVEYTTRDTPIQQRLDAFKASATPTFHTKDGDVNVPIPFRMTVPPSVLESADPRNQTFVAREHVVEANSTDLGVIARGAGLTQGQVEALKLGRSTPETIRRVSQALIDAGKLPPGTSADAAPRVRTMMSDYGIGIDCAGYVQQAFLASRGTTRAQTGLKPIDAEDLSGLSRKGFARVASTDIRAGDLFILGRPKSGEAGHTVIVRDSRMATPEEAQALKACATGWGNPDPSTIRRLEVDSSWGSSGDAQKGGVQRHFWWHDEASDRWMSESTGAWETGKTPYRDHPIDGIYRPSKEH